MPTTVHKLWYSIRRRPAHALKTGLAAKAGVADCSLTSWLLPIDAATFRRVTRCGINDPPVGADFLAARFAESQEGGVDLPGGSGFPNLRLVKGLGN